MGKQAEKYKLMDIVKCKTEAEEIKDSFLYLEEVNEDGGTVTYVLRWVVRDYRRIAPGIRYRCHYIRIGKSIHTLRILKYDTKARDLRDKRLFCILLGITPSPSDAEVSFVLIGNRNREIYPKNKPKLEHILDRECFYEFSESCVPTEHLDLVSVCKITVGQSVKVAIGIEKSTVCRDFEHLYDSGLLSDVKICVENREFDAHKTVLAARSPVFAAMFRNQMKENSENRIEVADSNETAVGELLRYLYAERTIPLTIDLALDLFELADKYDIQNLKSETANYLRCNFSIENILDILVAAHLHDEKRMKMEAIEYIANNLWYLLKSPKWKIFRSNLELVDCILAYLS